MSAHCLLSPIAGIHSETQSYSLLSRMSIFSASQIQSSYLNQSYSTNDLFCPTYPESSNTPHKISCSSSTQISNLRYTSIKTSPTFQAKLKDSLKRHASTDQESEKIKSMQAGKQFLSKTQRYSRPEAHSSFITKTFHHWEVHFHSRKQLWYFILLSFWLFTCIQFNL